MQDQQRAFYFRWVWANGWSELAGLGIVALLGWALSLWQGSQPSLTLVLGSGILMIVAGTLCEGVLVGLAQGRILRQRLPALSLHHWVRATAIGAGIAWALGMIPSTLAQLMQGSGEQGPPTIDGWRQYALAAAMGIVLGPFLGIPQWLQLRPHLRRAKWWIVANSAAWAAGMVIVFLGAGNVPAGSSVITISLFLALTCLGAGLLVGAVHGFFLLWLLHERPEDQLLKSSPVISLT